MSGWHFTIGGQVFEAHPVPRHARRRWFRETEGVELDSAEWSRLADECIAAHLPRHDRERWRQLRHGPDSPLTNGQLNALLCWLIEDVR